MKRSASGVVSLLVCAAILAAACTSDAEPANPGPTLSAEVASSDHFADSPQRFLIGLFAGDGKLVTYGQVSLAFGYGGTAEDPVDPPTPGPSTIASYLPTPGTPEGAGNPPTMSSPSDARGVYQADDVEFDRPGFWFAQVTADVQGAGSMRATTAFEVRKEPALPAPGQRALQTDNLTIRSADAPPGAIDSRAVASGGAIRDRALHEWTIAGAIEQGVPALVVFATPVFCESRFCGPVVDVVADLQERYGDRVAMIHVEIWRNYNKSVVNQAAADWLYRKGDLQEPWTYLIDADGRIVDRWATIFDPEEVGAALADSPEGPPHPVESQLTPARPLLRS